jgi:ligand-binding sensor domain-containing protein
MGAELHTSPHTKSDWTQNLNTGNGLICDTVLAIARDKSKNLWLGTTMGVSMYNGTNFTNYTIEDGLVNNKVNTIAIDIDGSVWFGTNNGISHFSNNKWTNYIK